MGGIMGFSSTRASIHTITHPAPMGFARTQPSYSVFLFSMKSTFTESVIFRMHPPRLRSLWSNYITHIF